MSFYRPSPKSSRPFKTYSAKLSYTVRVSNIAEILAASFQHCASLLDQPLTQHKGLRAAIYSDSISGNDKEVYDIDSGPRSNECFSQYC